MALTVLSSGYATSQPSSDIRARAAELEKDLEARNQQVAAVDRQLADAQKKVEYANAKATDAEARLKTTEDEIARIKSLLNGRAASIYKIGTALSPFEAVNVQDAKDLTARSKYTDVAAHHDDALVDNLATAKQKLSAQRDDADKAHAAAAAERDALAKAKADADAAAADQQRLLDQVNGEIE
ncbi:MAG: hypothetical protein M3046_14195, partial [Actinomycetota bacterium]|nr:hypothetical protein [Actinomycetota bacterium]